MADLVASADNLDEENVDETAASPLIELIELVTSQGGFIHPSTAFMQPAFEGGKADEGFGVFVDSAVAADTELIRVPLSVCISAQAVQAEPALQCVFNDNPGLLSYPDEVLALGLMYAMLHVEDTDKILEAAQLEHAPGKSDATASNSPSRLGSSRVGIWAKHVQTMPMTFNTTIFWSESEMQELKFNAVYHLTGMMRRQMEADFVNIHQPLARDYPQLLGGELRLLCCAVLYYTAVAVL